MGAVCQQGCVRRRGGAHNGAANAVLLVQRMGRSA